MHLSQFQTSTSGKWILAGEHSVLRGGPALVFPLLSRSFSLDFEPDPKVESLQVNEQSPIELDLAGPFWACFHKACEVYSVNPESLKGNLTIRSAIPAGAGLGASAALSVALARWFSAMTGTEGDPSQQARLLENVFHGESSGVDVTVVSVRKPMVYVRNKGFSFLENKWTPKLYLSYSGVQGMTKTCVEKVQALKNTDPDKFLRLDEQMSKAVHLAVEALQLDESMGFPQLKEAIEMASNCFAEWELLSPQMQTHLGKLSRCGAAATKPTGSGFGGYCLSLWKDEPHEALVENLIPCF